MGSGGAISAIALAGDPAPVGTFDQIGPTAIRDSVILLDGIYGGFTGSGVFTFQGGLLTTVIKTGDPLFGSTVMGVGSGKNGLDPDGSGRIVIAYGLADGRSGIALATPVPEPRSIAIAINLFCMVFLIRQRRN